jgi:hypothetical protein
MSKDYKNGRADAAAKKESNPPRDRLLDLITATKAERSKIPERSAEYREGYADKKREMREGKKK